MLSVGRCGVARLQIKVGHMDRMHCFIDSTTILVKMKSVSLYNCRIAARLIVMNEDRETPHMHKYGERKRLKL